VAALRIGDERFKLLFRDFSATVNWLELSATALGIITADPDLG
jgi:hypothetical protein